MLSLVGSELQVDLVDPTSDAHLLGPRYCSGGYIWQVHDRAIGPLLSGPEWPSQAPLPFNGQGLPESFRHRSRDGRKFTWQGSRGLAIGGGELAENAAGEAVLVEPCRWEIEQQPGRVVYQTEQCLLGYHCQVIRTVTLTGRQILSESTLRNLGSAPFALEWFAHPFFALSAGHVRAVLPAGTRLKTNPGFEVHERVLTQKRRFTHLTDGHMDFLELTPSESPLFELDHPSIEFVRFAPSFAPSECIVWGNDVTFSIEPYQILALGPGEARTWNLRYDFGASSKIDPPSDRSRTPARV